MGVLAKIRARRRWPRSAAGRDHPARRARWAGHRRADRRSRLRGPARFDRAWSRRPERSAAAGFILRAASGDAGIRADVSREKGRGDPRGGDAVSRPFAFRRTGRARKRLCRSRPGAVRLAQPRAGRLADGRAGEQRACGRPDHAAGAARRGADGRLGPGGVAAGRRGYRDAAFRTLQSPRSRAGPGVEAGARARQGGARRRHEAKAPHQWRRRDAAGGARRRQADGRRRRSADRRARFRRLGHACQ